MYLLLSIICFSHTLLYDACLLYSKQYLAFYFLCSTHFDEVFSSKKSNTFSFKFGFPMEFVDPRILSRPTTTYTYILLLLPHTTTTTTTTATSLPLGTSRSRYCTYHYHNYPQLQYVVPTNTNTKKLRQSQKQQCVGQRKYYQYQ